jgi:hypothetical protein
MKPLIAHASCVSPRRVGRHLLIGALLMGVGCVSQQTYDTTKKEADELVRALESARSELHELAERIAELERMNQKEDAVIGELRTAIQQEAEMAPVVRQRADEKLAALQTRVAYLVNQNRLLGRDMADAKQESVFLKAAMTQYRQEVEDARPLPSSFTSLPPAQPDPSPALTPIVPTPLPTAASIPEVSNRSSVPTKPATVSRSAKSEPTHSDDSWTGAIKAWVSSLWEWIFG